MQTGFPTPSGHVDCQQLPPPRCRRGWHCQAPRSISYDYVFRRRTTHLWRRRMAHAAFRHCSSIQTLNISIKNVNDNVESGMWSSSPSFPLMQCKINCFQGVDLLPLHCTELHGSLAAAGAAPFLRMHYPSAEWTNHCKRASNTVIVCPSKHNIRYIPGRKASSTCISLYLSAPCADCPPLAYLLFAPQ